MFFIYVILLINNTYSIISSEDKINQIHNTPNFKEIIEIIKSNDKSDFDKLVKKYVDEFGYDNIKVKTSEISKYDSTITEDDKKLVEYLDNMTNIDIIEQEIQKLTMLKQKILHLKQIIATTNITFTEEYNFGKFVSDYAKYKRFFTIAQKITSTRHRERLQEIENLPIEENQLFNYFTPQKCDKIRDIIYDISGKYHTYIQYEITNHKLPSNFTHDTDVLLQLYSTMYFNKKMNSHLTNFITKNGTEEQLITKLIYAYSKILF